MCCKNMLNGHRFVWDIQKDKMENYKSGSVLFRFQEEEPKIEVTLLLSSHILLSLHYKQYTSDLHIKLLQAFPVSSHPSHTTHPIVAI